MARKTFLCLTLAIGPVLSASPVLPCDDALFGPKEFKVGRFHFLSSFQSFKAGKSGDAILQISRANFNGRIHAGYVNLNGRFFSLSPILHAKNSTMQVPVYLHNRNYLWVFLYGQKGSAIKLKIKQAKQEQTNQPPIANNQDLELDEDTSGSVTLAGSDQDGDSLSFRIASGPAHGTLSGTPPTLTYAPLADYNGSDAFSFIVNEGQADSQPATVTITIRPVNDPPIALASAPAAARLGEQVPLDGSLSSDLDGDELTYLWTLTSYPAGLSPLLGNSNEASASLVPYMPGKYTIQLVVSDGKTYSTPAMVTLSVNEEKLTADDGDAAHRFGSSVSVDNNRAIIGAEGKGAAYIFESNSPWEQTFQLGAAEGAVGDHFGSAVAVSGDYALVGASGDDEIGEDSGAAYVFRYDGGTWFEEAKLLASEGQARDSFGAAVALSGDYAVVGAPGDDTGSDEWVSIFGEAEYTPAPIASTWDEDMKKWKNPGGNYIILKAAPSWANGLGPKAIRVNTYPEQLFLLQVAGNKGQYLKDFWDYLSGEPVPLADVADIGEIKAYAFSTPIEITNIEFLVPSTVGGPDAGSAYVFDRHGDTWIEQAYLTTSDGAPGDEFGISVAVSGQTIIVGAKGDADKGEDSGSAYVFVQDGAAWVEEAKILAEDGREGDQFGASVAIIGNIAVVGAPGADAAYIFWYDGDKWTEEAKLIGENEGDLFGASVSISGDYVVVGAPKADGSGAMYVFKFDGSEWILEGKVAPKEATLGQDFGRSVSISGHVILSGAPGDSEKGDMAGAAYAYPIDNYQEASLAAEP